MCVALRDRERALTSIKLSQVEAAAAADVSRLSAIQPTLVKALEGLGDKILGASMAENLPRAGGALSYILGTGGMAAFKKLAAGTRVGEALDTLGDDA